MLDVNAVKTRVEALVREWEKEYVRRTEKSRQLFERAKRILPGGVNYHIRYYKPYPVFIAKAKGAYVYDVDGNTYVDYWMGHGAHIMGHSPDFVVEAANKASKNGTHFGYVHELLIEYAELLSKIIPSAEMVKFACSGTEANMYAVRLARTYTKSKRIIKMQGGWHGGYDSLHVGVTPPYNVPESAGLPEDYIKYTTVVPFNDIEAVEKELKKGDVAAILLEPVLGAGGCIEAKPEYLRELRRLADSFGVLLIFDEVITGFRLSLGGAQEYYNVKPDITVLGKIVGGGYPGAGAIVGRADVMELLDHLKYPDPRSRSALGGTFTGNPVTLAAGYTLVNYLRKNKELYDKLNSIWDNARRELEEKCNQYGVDCYATGVGSMLGVHFTSKRPVNHYESIRLRWYAGLYDALHLYMRINNVLYLTEHTIHFLPSMVHTEEHARGLVSLFENFLAEVTRR